MDLWWDKIENIFSSPNRCMKCQGSSTPTSHISNWYMIYGTLCLGESKVLFISMKGKRNDLKRSCGA